MNINELALFLCILLVVVTLMLSFNTLETRIKKLEDDKAGDK